MNARARHDFVIGQQRPNTQLKQQVASAFSSRPLLPRQEAHQLPFRQLPFRQLPFRQLLFRQLLFRHGASGLPSARVEASHKGRLPIVFLPMAPRRSQEGHW